MQSIQRQHQGGESGGWILHPLGLVIIGGLWDLAEADCEPHILVIINEVLSHGNLLGLSLSLDLLCSDSLLALRLLLKLLLMGQQSLHSLLSLEKLRQSQCLVLTWPSFHVVVAQDGWVKGTEEVERKQT